MAVTTRKITFTSIVAAAYRGNISQLRTDLLSLASWLDRSPGAKTDVFNAITDFLTYVKGTATGILGASDAITIADVIGGADNVTSAGVTTVAGGVVTKATLPTNNKLVKSGKQYPGPAITGSYATQYTFTIVNGLITAIVAS